MAKDLPAGFVLDKAESKGATLPDGFVVDAQPTPVEKSDSKIHPTMQAKIDEAFAEGDVALAEFLQRSAKDMSTEELSPIERVGEGLSQFGKRAGFEVGRRAEFIKEKFTGEKRMTEKARSTPEIGQYTLDGVMMQAASLGYRDLNKAIEDGAIPPVPSFKDGLKMTALQLSKDEEEKISIARGLSKAVGIIPDSKGNMFVLFENGAEMQMNRPGYSGMDVEELSSKGALFGLGSALGGPGFYGQALGAMGSQGTMEAATYLAGGTFDTWEIAVAPAFEALGIGGSKLLSKALVKMDPTVRAGIKDWTDLEGKIPKKDFENVKKAMEASKTLEAPAPTGSQIFSRGKAQGQAERAVKAVQTSPEQAERLAKEYASQDTFSDAKVRSEVERIFDSDDAIGVGMKKTREASSKVFEKLDSIKDANAKKYFGEAFKENGGQGALVDYNKLRNFVKEQRNNATFTGDEQKSMDKVLGFLTRQDPLIGKVFSIRSAPGRDAQKVKFQIDRLIAGRGEDAVGKDAKKALIKVKNMLIDEIESTNKGYRAANARYQADMAPIDEIEDTILGVYRKTGEATEERISRLFNTKSLDTITKVKGYLDEVDPSAYPALYRGWLDSKIGKLPTSENLLESTNPAKVIESTFFGTPAEARKMIELAPNQSTKKNLMALRDYLGYSKKLRMGSVSKEDIDIPVGKTDISRGTVIPAAEAAAGAFSFIKGKITERRLKAIADTLTNPKWAEDIAKARKAGIRSGQLDMLFNRVLLEMAQAERPSIEEVQEEMIQQPE